MQTIIIAIIIGVVISFIIVSIQKSSLTTVRKESAASNYVKKETFKLRVKEEHFLYKKLEQTPRQQPQSQNGQQG